MWSPCKQFLLEALYGIAMRLERHKMLITTTETIFKVLEVMGDVMSVRIWVKWLDRLIIKSMRNESLRSLCDKLTC